jgi:hypothetical protein
MCKAFSCIATRKKVYWQLGIDHHNNLANKFKLDDTKKGNIIPIEIVPKDYLNMTKPSQKNKDWEFKFDEECPEWWKSSNERMCWSACKEWHSKIMKLVNWKEARNPIHPFKLKIVENVSIKQKLLLKEYDSVWDSVRNSVGNSVGASVWNSVGNSVRNSVWNSVWGYIGSLFYLKRNQWKYTEKIKTRGYPFQCVVDLWKQGLVPSFDGKTWRLHSGKKAKVVFEISKEDLRKLEAK